MALKIVEGWKGLDPPCRGASIALGNFDGVHLGHMQVIAVAAQAAGRLGAPLGVISFEPHPRRWFNPHGEPFRLMTLDQQARVLSGLGADLLYVLPFDQEMANMSDEAFARDVLARGLGARHVAAGFDITFGKGRAGDAEKLKRYGETYGFGVSTAARVDSPEGGKCSSTAIRNFLKTGQPEKAAELMGRAFAIEGVVVHGDHLGRTLGFPTANVSLEDYVRPAFGIYASRTRLPDGRELPGVAYVGRRPTVNGIDERLEVNLFDFDEDIYGQTIETDLVAYLRGDQKFEGLDALKAQIGRDADAARKLLLPEL